MADVTELSGHTGLKRNFRDNGDGTHAEEFGSQLRAWDATSLTWVKLLVDHASGALSAGSGGGGAVTIADGANVAQGSTTDLSSASTVVGILKAIKAAITGTLTVSGAVTTGGLTDTQLRATPVPVSGTVTASGPLTDTQLRATPVPVSGTVTATTGGLTDTQLRATPVPVSGTVTAATGGLTDTQLRATAVPVSAASLPLPSGAAADATFTAAVGAAESSPAAYTVLDQLTKLRKAAEAELKLVQQLIALQTPALPRKTQATLLHRSL